MVTKKVFFIAALISSMTAYADPIKMAHDAGFTGCDDLINEKLKRYTHSGNGHINIEYDSVKMKNKAISFLATYGESGDTVLQKITFIHSDGACTAYELGQISTPKSCIQEKEEGLVWKYVTTQGDNVWTENAGGVIAIFKTAPSNGCIVTYNNSSQQ